MSGFWSQVDFKISVVSFLFFGNLFFCLRVKYMIHGYTWLLEPGQISHTQSMERSHESGKRSYPYVKKSLKTQHSIINSNWSGRSEVTLAETRNSRLFGPYSCVSHLMSYSLNTRGCVPVHAHTVTRLNLVCLQGQPHFQMSLNIKYINRNSCIYLFIPYVRSKLFFVTIRSLGLLAGACKLKSMVVRIIGWTQNTLSLTPLLIFWHTRKVPGQNHQ